MAKKKPVRLLAEPIVFEHERMTFKLIHVDPNTMEVLLVCIDDGTERKLPFAHLPKSVKKKIRPL